MSVTPLLQLCRLVYRDRGVRPADRSTPSSNPAPSAGSRPREALTSRWPSANILIARGGACDRNVAGSLRTVT